MMRLRRASAIAAFSLLTSAATVYAQCTWVLRDNEWSLEPSFWERWFESDTKTWLSALPSKRSRIASGPRGELSAPWNQSKPAGPQIRFYCFPDTMDPRGWCPGCGGNSGAVSGHSMI